MQVTSCVQIWVVVINYGKIKSDIAALCLSREVSRQGERG